MPTDQDNSKTNVHTGHRERLRERYQATGLEGFAEHEVLEMLLFSVIPQRDTNPIAHELLNRYGSLSAVLEADPEDMLTIRHMNRNAALLLTCMPHVFGRYQQSKQDKGSQFLNGVTAGEYCVGLFSGKSYESLYLLCLDMDKRLKRAELVQKGTISEVPVYSRLLVATALRHQAAFAILSHNHPGGTTMPSDADMQVTKRTRNALDTIGVELLDHIIVSGSEHASLMELGFWMDNQFTTRGKLNIPPRRPRK